MSVPATSLLDTLLPTPKSAGGDAIATKAAAGGEVASAPSFNAVMAAAIAKAAGAGQAIAGQAGLGQKILGQAGAGQAGMGQAGMGQAGAKLSDAPGTDGDASPDAAALLLFAANGQIPPGTPPAGDRAVATPSIPVAITPPATGEAPSARPGAAGLAIATTVAASDIPQVIAAGLNPAGVATSGSTLASAAQTPAVPAAGNAIPTATPQTASKDAQTPATPTNATETRPTGPQGSGPGGASAAITLVAGDARAAAPATPQTSPTTLSGESAIVASEAARVTKPVSAETARGDRAKPRASTSGSTPTTSTPAAPTPTQATAAAATAAIANAAGPDADARAPAAQTAAAAVGLANLAQREAARGGAGEDKPDGLPQAGPLAAGARNVAIQDAGARAAKTAAKTAQPSTTPVVDQVVVHLRTALDQGIDRLDIRLKPASLGHITVKLDVSGNGQVTAVITADRPDTLNMLQRDARGLERALQDAGLQTNQGSLDFNLRGDGGFAGQQGGSGGFAGYGGGHSSDAFAGSRTPAPIEIQAVPAASAPRGPSTRALDIEV